MIFVEEIMKLKEKVAELKAENEKLKQVEIETNVECATNEYIDKKRIYRKRIDCGSGPNNVIKSVQTGLSNVTYEKIEGIMRLETSAIPLNSTRPLTPTDNSTVGVFINNNMICLESKADRSSMYVFVDIYYTKN
ncbi:MAG: hypothetical protein HFJ52_03960 [Clostridia bacterium]|jgi:hypothetical protein|nr:hypothetical protein [Clostridia bacterium]